ncbi:hypothetical protein [Pseudonocardia asaccharolytica]|uniref:Integral membrane protein n=1 Tax=Pseudonocardia asaccharolytica DSM 44247 = NBRC 16224 TaxID=1123024 RepID=A0A511D6K7_9PSEU|nr:hypothetical protein [Pseudonocardia asaccharolytica]GEL20402.1 hypothetical protein PA7_42390 [Pseudonocardia asaccharolytica DSM 44247 = NBRC 16224]
MEILRLLLVFLHFIGLAVLIGAFVAQVSGRPKGGGFTVTSGMLHGALTQLVTGLALVGIREGALDLPVDNVKIGVKLLVLIAILALVLVGRRKSLATGGFMAIGLLSVLNVGIAVFWT